MGKEREKEFEEFKRRILLIINEIGIDENVFSEGKNFIRLTGKNNNLSLVIEKNPTDAGGSVEWALQKDEEHMRRGSLSDGELKSSIRMWMQSLLSGFGLEVKDENGFLCMEVGTQKYVFCVYSGGELISGYIIKKSNS